ncbi:predicted protein [Nematostella vectensis]|uniref:Tetraspanin n=2 Tax=Nematostella vectensis TaxID=45351 RepID=A7S486_NEMVE|nr:predicted protein [Nematostella vectensis]|eukprot:XP_001633495.1 predicted protein [Nematostella vectensis]
MPTLLFFTGFSLYLIVFFGCVGALKENTLFLASYGIFIFCCLIPIIAAGVLAFLQREKLVDPKARLEDGLKSYQQDSSKQEFIDFIQTRFKCCGIESYKDWQANRYFSCSSPVPTACGVPFSCCKKSIQGNRQCGYDAGKLKTDADRLENGVYSKGCVVVVGFIKDVINLVIGVMFAGLIFIIVAMIMAFSFRAQIREVQKNARFQSELGIQRGF